MVSFKIDLVRIFSAVIVFNVFTCFVTGLPGDKEQRKIESEDLQEAFWNEMECLQEGGICMPADECPEGHAANDGLCPAQRENGVECCHGLSQKERVCSNRGGMCRSKIQCPESLRISYADDCQSHEICCALV